MPLSFRLGLAGIVLFLLACIATNPAAAAEDWQPAFQWPGGNGDVAAWKLSGMVGRDNALLSAGGESTATLPQAFDAPAVRVTYDADLDPGDDGKISDLSLFIGDVFFCFGGQYNTQTFIRRGSVTSEPGSARIEPGKTHQVVATVDGRLASLSVDGLQVAQLLLDEAAPGARAVTLYAWCGVARFQNVRVYTKAQASPLPAEMLESLRYGKPTPQTLAHLRDWSTPTFAAGRAAAVERASVALTVDPGPAAQSGVAWPITRGVPFPADTLYDPAQVRLLDERGREIPLQTTVTATWSQGGAIRWLLLDFILPDASRPRTLTLEYGRAVQRQAVDAPVQVNGSDTQYEVSSGPATFVISRQRGTVWESASLRGQTVLGSAEGYYTTAQGWRYSTSNSEELSVEVELAGPIRTVIRSRGWYTDASGRRACYFVRRLHIYRGLPWARLVNSFVISVDTHAYTFTNTGIHTRLHTPIHTTVFGLSEGAKRLKIGEKTQIQAAATALDSGIFSLDGQAQPTGALPGWISARSANAGFTLACYEMARQFPAALSVDAQGVSFHGFSAAAGYDLDLTLRGLTKIWGEKEIEWVNANRGAYPPLDQRNPSGVGLAKTHELMLLLHDAHSDGGVEAAMFQDPPIVSADPNHVCDSGVVGPGPYYPYDPQRFPQQEQFIEQQRDRFLSFVDRCEPQVGFWDYGSGNPHLDTAGEALDARYRIDGYRRTYDMGYQQPLAPWMMYLRSGQRAWLQYAIRNSRGLADSRIQHWTHPAYAKRVGWSVQDHGAFAWDTNLAEWGFNIYTPFLLSHYYVTGDERAMDEHTLVLDAFVQGGQTYYVASVGVWLGNVAAAYRATWEPAYLEKFKQLQQDMLECICEICGGINNNEDTGDEDHDYHGTIHRAGFVEYGIVEALQVEGHDERLRQVLIDDGKRRIESGEAVGDNVMAYARLLAYQHNADPRSAREAADVLDRFTRFPNNTFTHYHGLSSARHLPVLMHLAAKPGLQHVQVPVQQRYRGTLYVQHTQGRTTELKVRVPQKRRDLADVGVRATTLQGAELPGEQVWYDAVLGDVHLRLEASSPSAVVCLHLPPQQSLTVIHEPDQPVMIGVPQGYQHVSGEPMPTLYFRVPAGVRQFRLRNSLPMRAVTVTAPDGRRIRSAPEQRWLSIDVPGDSDQAWAMQVEHVDHYNFQALKLYDIPALVALTPQSLFSMTDPPMAAADYQPMQTAGSFTDGVLGQALHLRGQDMLDIPLGAPTSPSARQRLDTARGTIEFFFLLNADPVFVGFHSLPMEIAADESVTMKGWTRQWFSFFKNAAMFSTPDGRQITGEGACFGPWDGHVGMTRFKPGQWHHIAIVWDSDKPLQEGHVVKRKNQVRVYIDGQLSSNGVYDQVQWLTDAYAAPLPAAGIVMHALGRDVLIDELRISDIERVPFTEVGKELTYPVPLTPLQVDEHTRLLMHFDGDVQGAGAGNDAFTAELRAGS